MSSVRVSAVILYLACQMYTLYVMTARDDDLK